MIVEANNNQRLSGISICRGSPKITHLFCANDKLLFCKVERQESQTLVEILGRYEMVSGKKINADKCSIFFSQNTTLDTRREVLCTLGPMQDTRHGKYLGLPSIIGKSKNQVFVEIKEKVGKPYRARRKKCSQWVASRS